MRAGDAIVSITTEGAPGAAARHGCPFFLCCSWLPSQFRAGPKDAPAAIVRAIETDAQALAVAMQAGGCKCAYIGAVIGKSEGYISRLRSGKRQIPESLVRRLCLATGSNLLAQVRALRSALNGDPQSINAGLAARLREVA